MKTIFAVLAALALTLASWSPALADGPRITNVRSATTGQLLDRRAELLRMFKEDDFGVAWGISRWISHATDKEASKKELTAINAELARREIAANHLPPMSDEAFQVPKTRQQLERQFDSLNKYLLRLSKTATEQEEAQAIVGTVNIMRRHKQEFITFFLAHPELNYASNEEQERATKPLMRRILQEEGLSAEQAKEATN